MTPAAVSLGDVPVRQFLSEYWQKRPLLVRQAGSPPAGIGKDELVETSCYEGADSRLIVGDGKTVDWQVVHGPLDITDIPTGNSPWTILLRHAETWFPDLADLQHAFSFVPSWRHQDVMASFASPGGSVGPHTDRYDVFLYQGAGSRTWSIGDAVSDDEAEWFDHEELRLLKRLDPVAEYSVEPGDLLYLPPNVPHWGIASTDCITYSIGFRTPAASELLMSLAALLSERGIDTPYADPDLDADEAGPAISHRSTERVRRQLQAALADDRLISDALALWASEPIGDVSGDPDLEQGDRWVRVPGSRITVSSGGALFADGESVPCTANAAPLAQEIAANARWSGRLEGWSDDETALLHALAEVGALIEPD